MTAIGIDFGYSVIRVAIFNANKEIELVEDESDDLFAVPVVAFDGQSRLFGYEALDLCNTPPAAVFGIKRLIGKEKNDNDSERQLKDFFSRYSYNVNYSFEQRKLKIKIEPNNAVFSAKEILAMMFDNIKETAEKYLSKCSGSTAKIEKAVISVPSLFTHNQRQSIINAAKIAGIEVKRLLNDTTAVAVNEAFSSTLKKKILIINFGASALEISLIEIDNKNIKVICTAGSAELGGENFDNSILNYCIDELNKKSITLTPQQNYRLRRQCETAKIQLQGTKFDYVIRIHTDKGGQSLNLTYDIFEQLSRNIFEEAMNYVRKVLSDSDCDEKTIDEVCLVGGSSRLKNLKSCIDRLFVSCKPKIRLINSDVVARGCLIFVAKMTEEFQYAELNNLNVAEIMPFNIGVKQGPNSPVTFIVSRGTVIPHKQSVLMLLEANINHDSSTNSAFIDVVISNSDFAFKYEKLMTIRLYEVLTSHVGVRLHFEIDENFIFSFQADVLGAHNNTHLNVEYLNNVSNEVDEATTRLIQYKEKNQEEEKRIAVKNDLEKQIYQMQHLLNKNQENLFVNDFKSMAERVNLSMNWFNECADFAIEEQLNDKYNSLTSLLNEMKECVVKGERRKNEYFKIVASSKEEIKQKLQDIENENPFEKSVLAKINFLSQFDFHRVSFQKNIENTDGKLNAIEDEFEKMMSEKSETLLKQIADLVESSQSSSINDIPMFLELDENLSHQLVSIQTYLKKAETKEKQESLNELINKFTETSLLTEGVFKYKLNPVKNIVSTSEAQRSKLNNAIDESANNFRQFPQDMDKNLMSPDKNSQTNLGRFKAPAFDGTDKSCKERFSFFKESTSELSIGAFNFSDKPPSVFTFSGSTKSLNEEPIKKIIFTFDPPQETKNISTTPPFDFRSLYSEPTEVPRRRLKKAFRREAFKFDHPTSTNIASTFKSGSQVCNASMATLSPRIILKNTPHITLGTDILSFEEQRFNYGQAGSKQHNNMTTNVSKNITPLFRRTLPSSFNFNERQYTPLKSATSPCLFGSQAANATSNSLSPLPSLSNSQLVELASTLQSSFFKKKKDEEYRSFQLVRKPRLIRSPLVASKSKITEKVPQPIYFSQTSKINFFGNADSVFEFKG